MTKKVTSKKFVKFSIVFILLLGLGLGGFIFKTQSVQPEDVGPTISEQRVRYGDIKIDFIGDGEAEIAVVNLDFQVTGEIMEVNVEVGQDIKKGDIVAKLDDTEYVKKLRSAQIDYDKAKAKLEQVKQNIELEIITEKQKLDDYKFKLDQLSAEYLPMLEIKQVYSEQAIELKKASYESAKSAYETQLKRYEIIANDNKDIEMEEANLEAAKISLEIAQDNLDKTILTAPMDAKVLSITYRPGETISSNSEHFMVISDAEKVEVIVPVSEIDLGSVSEDQIVEVEFEAFEGKVFTGKVLEIDSLPKIDSSGLVTYDVSMELDDGIDEIKTGMTCSVSFILNQRKNVLIIPNKAVSIVEGRQIVNVKNKDGNVEERKIITGLTDGTNVEVIEGLESGETIIINTMK